MSTAQRSMPISMKGQTFYVEPSYGRRYDFVTGIIFYVWTVGAAGMVYLKRDEIKAKFK